MRFCFVGLPLSLSYLQASQLKNDTFGKLPSILFLTNIYVPTRDSRPLPPSCVLVPGRKIQTRNRGHKLGAHPHHVWLAQPICQGHKGKKRKKREERRKSNSIKRKRNDCCFVKARQKNAKAIACFF